MHFIYSVLLALGLLVLLPKFLLDAWRYGKYLEGLSERLGFLTSIQSEGRPVIWLHCVSVGETQAARPLVQAIRKQFPHYLIAISTVTVTGQRLAGQVFGNESAKVFYFPIDWRWTVRRTLRAINPSVVLLMETELWPGFLRECSRQQIPVAVVNGRLSEQSFRRYKLIPRFISKVVNCLDLAVMQTQADAGRMQALGLPPERLVVSGSLKFDAGAINDAGSHTEALRQRFQLDESSVILAASTHDPEERIILQAFSQLRADPALEKTRLIIAPRHPERFPEVASLLNSSGLKWVRRTADAAPEDAASQVLLLDTIGELRSAFPLASIVFVGGSLVPAGGHNIIEPAAAGSCIVTGPHTENFQEIVGIFKEAHAIVEVPPVSESEFVGAVAAIFSRLLRTKEQRQSMGARAKSLIAENQGATARTMTILTELLKAEPKINQPAHLASAQNRTHVA